MLKSRRKQVLIADNDQEVLIALEWTLETEGYDTAVALGHDEIIRMLATRAFDLLVLDDCLSDCDCAEVLSQCQHAGIEPLVIVTYYRPLSFADEHKLRSLGVSAWVSKPAQFQLAAMVRHLLKDREDSGEFDCMT